MMKKYLRDDKFPEMAHLRQCQECMRYQVCKHPKDYKDDSWKDLKCKFCKSEALDYGTQNVYWLDEDDE